ncbi:hypothetical protein Tco_0083425 [Tanacetum coccineum]
MDDPNVIMEEYIRLEEEKAQKRGKVFNWETAKYGRIWYNEDVHDLRSVENKFPAIAFDDSLTSGETLSCEPTISSLDDEIDFKISFDDSDDEDYTDLDFFKDFENEFPAIVYNDAPTSKLDLLTEPILSSQHIDEFDLNDETSLSEYDEEEQNILYFNDLFPFNMIHPNDLKSEKDNDDNEIDIIQSLGGLELTQTYGGSGSTNTGGTVVPEILDVRIQSEYDFFKPANLHEASQHGPVHCPSGGGRKDNLNRDKCPKARNQQNDGARAELSGGENPQHLWLSLEWIGWHNYRALIDCYEKIVRIPLPNGEILEVQGERPKKDLGSLACIKADEKKLDDIRIVRDFPEGSPSENVRIVEPAQELQKKVLFDQVTSPWGAPVLLSRRRMVRVASPS